MKAVTANPQDERVLVQAPTGRDAELACRVLSQAGIPSQAFRDMSSLCKAISAEAGAILLTDEALREGVIAMLLDCLEKQPPWSDLPLLLLVSGEASAENLLRAFGTRASVTILERPIHLTTFTSAVRAALSARRRQYEIRDLLVKLEEANRLKDEFLATLSHELRSPLNTIVGNAEILLRSPQTQHLPLVRRSAESIERNASAQAKLISDLLDLSRMQTGKFALDQQIISLSSVITDAIEAVRESAAAKRITLRIDLVPEAVWVWADTVRIDQIVWNLLNNAIKFTPEGGLVTIGLTCENGDAKLTIEDNGQGIEPAFLPHLFDMFRQADARITRQHGGMGIGLALVRQLVELHGGRIEAASEGVGQGARFTVWLPRQTAQWEEEPLVMASDGGRLANLQILVVDDTPDSADMLQMLLLLEGANVQTATSAAEALHLIANRQFDLLVSDVAMPEMDGYELLQELRKRPVAPPAIAVTGFGRDVDIERAQAAGFASHITKPVQLERLVEAIEQVVKKNGHHKVSGS